MRLGGEPSLMRRLLRLLAMFINPREEEGIVTEKTMVPGENVGDSGRIEGAEMRSPINVINRGGNVKR
jgi:hypothetical protein